MSGHCGVYFRRRFGPGSAYCLPACCPVANQGQESSPAKRRSGTPGLICPCVPLPAALCVRPPDADLGPDAVDPGAVAFEGFHLQPIRLVNCALMNPRTLCGCQPVAVMMVCKVAPSGCFNSARIRSVLVPAGCVLAVALAVPRLRAAF